MAVESKIRALGYTPRSLSSAASRVLDITAKDERTAGDRPWWQTRKGPMVVGLGGAARPRVRELRWQDLTSRGGLTAQRPLSGSFPSPGAHLPALCPARRFSIETLMTVAAAGAIAIGAAEEAAVVIFLFAVGELLETVAAGRARAGIKALINLVPRIARIEEDGQVREVPVERLRVGDIVVVRPGDRVPSDGEVIEGGPRSTRHPLPASRCRS